MKNIKNIYVVEVFTPEEITLTTEFGLVDLRLCKKEGENYIDLNNNKSYQEYQQIGYTKVISATPLSEYYFNYGIRKINNHENNEEVRKLVKKTKKNYKI